MSPAFAARLRELDGGVRSYRSGHSYTLEQFDLDEATVRERFAQIYERFDFDAANGAPKMAAEAAG